MPANYFNKNKSLPNKIKLTNNKTGQSRILTRKTNPKIKSYKSLA